MQILELDKEVDSFFSPSVSHGHFSFSLSGHLFGMDKGKENVTSWWILHEIMVTYGNNEQMFIHDFAGWKKTTLPSLSKEKKVTVRPDWVCEILSGNRSNDTIKKMKWLYHFGVPNYWIVDAERNYLQAFVWTDKGYLLQDMLADDEKKAIEPFAETIFDGESLFFV
jgi:hypothetical protein